MNKSLFIVFGLLFLFPFVASCGGCVDNEHCYLVGEVTDIGGTNMFCDFSHSFSPLKNVNNSCTNDFECRDGLICLGEKCSNMEDYQGIDSEYDELAEDMAIFNSFCSFSDEKEFCFNYSVPNSTLVSSKNCSFDDSYDSSFKCYKCNSGFKWDGEECINESIETARCSKNTFLTSSEFLTGFSCNVSRLVLISFNLDGVVYYIHLKTAGDFNAQFVLTKRGSISSNSFSVNYNTNTKIDVDSDGTYDIILTANKINSNRVEFFIKRTYEKVPGTNTCTSFTYSSWSNCNSDGIQSRTILSRLPTGCVGGNSESLTKDCSASKGDANKRGLLLLILLGVVIFLIIVVVVLYFLVNWSGESNSERASKNPQERVA